MPVLETTFTKEDVCPDIILENTTVYPTNTSHDRSNFSEFVRSELEAPNGYLLALGMQPPSDNVNEFTLESQLVGKFVLNYVSLPTPPEEPIVGQGTLYQNNECFYYKGVIYKVIVASANIPVPLQTNDETIEILLDDEEIAIVSESEISSKYKCRLPFVHWCNLKECLKSKLHFINCKVIEEPTRTDICQFDEYEQITQLNFIQYLVNGVFPNPYEEDEIVDGQIEKAANYVNSICTCKKC